MESTFTITEKQLQQVEEWDKCKDKYHGAIDGHLTYEFTPTGIGVFVSVKCSSCEETLDLTDYNDL